MQRLLAPGGWEAEHARCLATAAQLLQQSLTAWQAGKAAAAGGGLVTGIHLHYVLLPAASSRARIATSATAAAGVESVLESLRQASRQPQQPPQQQQQPPKQQQPNQQQPQQQQPPQQPPPARVDRGRKPPPQRQQQQRQGPPVKLALGVRQEWAESLRQQQQQEEKKQQRQQRQQRQPPRSPAASPSRGAGLVADVQPLQQPLVHVGPAPEQQHAPQAHRAPTGSSSSSGGGSSSSSSSSSGIDSRDAALLRRLAAAVRRSERSQPPLAEGPSAQQQQKQQKQQHPATQLHTAGQRSAQLFRAHNGASATVLPGLLQALLQAGSFGRGGGHGTDSYSSSWQHVAAAGHEGALASDAFVAEEQLAESFEEYWGHELLQQLEEGEQQRTEAEAAADSNGGGGGTTTGSDEAAAAAGSSTAEDAAAAGIAEAAAAQEEAAEAAAEDPWAAAAVSEGGDVAAGWSKDELQAADAAAATSDDDDAAAADDEEAGTAVDVWQAEPLEQPPAGASWLPPQQQQQPLRRDQLQQADEQPKSQQQQQQAEEQALLEEEQALLAEAQAVLHELDRLRKAPFCIDDTEVLLQLHEGSSSSSSGGGGGSEAAAGPAGVLQLQWPAVPIPLLAAIQLGVELVRGLKPQGLQLQLVPLLRRGGSGGGLAVQSTVWPACFAWMFKARRPAAASSASSIRSPYGLPYVLSCMQGPFRFELQPSSSGSSSSSSSSSAGDGSQAAAQAASRLSTEASSSSTSTSTSTSTSSTAQEVRDVSGGKVAPLLAFAIEAAAAALGIKVPQQARQQEAGSSGGRIDGTTGAGESARASTSSHSLQAGHSLQAAGTTAAAAPGSWQQQQQQQQLRQQFELVEAAAHPLYSPEALQVLHRVTRMARGTQLEQVLWTQATQQVTLTNGDALLQLAGSSRQAQLLPRHAMTLPTLPPWQPQQQQQQPPQQQHQGVAAAVAAAAAAPVEMAASWFAPLLFAAVSAVRRPGQLLLSSGAPGAGQQQQQPVALAAELPLHADYSRTRGSWRGVLMPGTASVADASPGGSPASAVAPATASSTALAAGVASASSSGSGSSSTGSSSSHWLDWLVWDGIRRQRSSAALLDFMHSYPHYIAAYPALPVALLQQASAVWQHTLVVSARGSDVSVAPAQQQQQLEEAAEEAGAAAAGAVAVVPTEAAAEAAAVSDGDDAGGVAAGAAAEAAQPPPPPQQLQQLLQLPGAAVVEARRLHAQLVALCSSRRGTPQNLQGAWATAAARAARTQAAPRSAAAPGMVLPPADRAAALVQLLKWAVRVPELATNGSMPQLLQQLGGCVQLLQPRALLQVYGCLMSWEPLAAWPKELHAPAAQLYTAVVQRVAALSPLERDQLLRHAAPQLLQLATHACVSAAALSMQRTQAPPHVLRAIQAVSRSSSRLVRRRPGAAGASAAASQPLFEHALASWQSNAARVPKLAAAVRKATASGQLQQVAGLLAGQLPGLRLPFQQQQQHGAAASNSRRLAASLLGFAEQQRAAVGPAELAGLLCCLAAAARHCMFDSLHDAARAAELCHGSPTGMWQGSQALATLAPAVMSALTTAQQPQQQQVQQPQLVQRGQEAQQGQQRAQLVAWHPLAQLTPSMQLQLAHALLDLGLRDGGLLSRYIQALRVVRAPAADAALHAQQGGLGAAPLLHAWQPAQLCDLLDLLHKRSMQGALEGVADAAAVHLRRLAAALRSAASGGGIALPLGRRKRRLLLREQLLLQQQQQQQPPQGAQVAPGQLQQPPPPLQLDGATLPGQLASLASIVHALSAAGHFHKPLLDAVSELLVAAAAAKAGDAASSALKLRTLDPASLERFAGALANFHRASPEAAEAVQDWTVRLVAQCQLPTLARLAWTCAVLGLRDWQLWSSLKAALLHSAARGGSSGGVGSAGRARQQLLPSLWDQQQQQQQPLEVQQQQQQHEAQQQQQQQEMQELVFKLQQQAQRREAEAQAQAQQAQQQGRVQVQGRGLKGKQAQAQAQQQQINLVELHRPKGWRQPVTTQLYQASAFATLYVPGVAPLLPAHLAAVSTFDWQRNTKDVYVSQLQRDVADVLLKMAKAGNTKVSAAELEHKTPVGSIDLLVRYAGVGVAVEVDGPPHYATNSRTLRLGSSELRDRLLGALGLKVLAVPYFVWAEVYDKADTRKAAALLERELAKLVAPPGGRGARVGGGHGK